MARQNLSFFFSRISFVEGRWTTCLHFGKFRIRFRLGQKSFPRINLDGKAFQESFRTNSDLATCLAENSKLRLERASFPSFSLELLDSLFGQVTCILRIVQTARSKTFAERLLSSFECNRSFDATLIRFRSRSAILRLPSCNVYFLALKSICLGRR